MWKALKDDIEEDDEVRHCQSSKRDIVDQGQSRTRDCEAFVEDHQGKLDGPQRADIKDRARGDHLHDTLEVFRGYSGHVTKSEVPHVLLDNQIANKTAKCEKNKEVIGFECTCSFPLCPHPQSNKRHCGYGTDIP